MKIRCNTITNRIQQCKQVVGDRENLFLKRVFSIEMGIFRRLKRSSATGLKDSRKLHHLRRRLARMRSAYTSAVRHVEPAKSSGLFRQKIVRNTCQRVTCLCDRARRTVTGGTDEMKLDREALGKILLIGGTFLARRKRPLAERNTCRTPSQRGWDLQGLVYMSTLPKHSGVGLETHLPSFRALEAHTRH